MKQYIYGKNPIMEALKGASVYKIYMLNGHKDPKIFDICKRNQIPLEFVDKKEFDKKVGKVVHQGVMAYIENYRYYTIDEILKDEGLDMESFYQKVKEIIDEKREN